jgi:hypothetical protein
VHELTARGVTKQRIVLPGRDTLFKEPLEQPFYYAKGPLLPRIGPAILIVQIAEVIPEMFRKGRFGKLDGKCQDTRFVDQIVPIIPIIPSIATDPMVHEQNRDTRVVIAWPCGVQYKRAIRE